MSRLREGLAALGEPEFRKLFLGQAISVVGVMFTVVALPFAVLEIGGSATEDAALGKILGRGVSADEVVDVVEKIVDTYLDLRTPGEVFIDTYRRVGQDPFKERVYGAH